MKTNETYSIHYGERIIGDKAGQVAIAITKKLPWYSLRGQEGLSHTFLTLKNSAGEIVQQIHAVFLDKTRGQFAAILTKAMDNETRQTRLKANTTLFNRAVRLNKPPQVKLVALVGDASSDMMNFLSEPNNNPRLLLKGNKNDVEKEWRKTLLGVRDINKADLPFTGYSYLQPGQSCNSVTATLMDVMGLSKDFNSPHVRAGFGRTLHNVLFSKNEPHKSIEDLKTEIMAGYQDHMAEADARFAKKKLLQEKLGYLL